MKLKQNGYLCSFETRRKMGKAHMGNKYRLGKKHSEETKRRISENSVAWKPEVRKKISEANKGKIGVNKGKKFSKEWREKMSIAHKGKILSDETRKKMSKSFKGRIVTEETKRKIGLKNKGENNGNWRGGSSRFPYPLGFNDILKKSIRQRDNYACQLCNKKEGEELDQHNRRLAIHHIDYDKNNLNPYNLITLCGSCNTKMNSNREHWTTYFQQELQNIKNKYYVTKN